MNDNKTQKTESTEEKVENHRIRPDDMCIMEAMKIGHSYLEKQSNYKEIIEVLKEWDE